MFNVTVLKMKDLIKCFFVFIITVFIIVFISKSINKNISINRNKGIKEDINNIKEKIIVEDLKRKIESISNKKLINSLDTTLPVIAEINNEENNKLDKKEGNGQDFFENILSSQISSIDKIGDSKVIEDNKIDDNKIEKENIEENNEKVNNDTSLTQIGLATEVVTNNPISENYNVQYGNVKIKNQTDYELKEDMLDPNINIVNKNIIIFHTHSCESYTPSEKFNYTQTGTFRTTDLDFTVTKVGCELEKQLNQYNINVIHNTDYHDYPSYNGSYTRSLATVNKILETNKADIIIDLHRDAIGSRSDYAPCVKIGESDIAAQIMFVIGTNGGGLWHPNWNQNLKFAVKVQQKAEEMYPRIVQAYYAYKFKI